MTDGSRNTKIQLYGIIININIITDDDLVMQVIQGSFSQMVYELRVRFFKLFIHLFAHISILISNQVTISQMSGQLSCHGMCKTETWLNHFHMRARHSIFINNHKKNPYFAHSILFGICMLETLALHSYDQIPHAVEYTRHDKMQSQFFTCMIHNICYY